MLRRVATSTAPLCASQCRFVSKEHKEITKPGAPLPPMVTKDSYIPMDFSPHIEWYEYPKEIFNHAYPYTREEQLRCTDEVWESTQEEMGSRYGIRLAQITRFYFWAGYIGWIWYGWFYLWGFYRSMGPDPKWAAFRAIVETDPNHPTVEEDDVYLDNWINPVWRARWCKWDRFWRWKPVVNRDGATKHQWALPDEKLDPSEWRHMTSRT